MRKSLGSDTSANIKKIWCTVYCIVFKAASKMIKTTFRVIDLGNWYKLGKVKTGFILLLYNWTKCIEI